VWNVLVAPPIAVALVALGLSIWLAAVVALILGEMALALLAEAFD
jgi:hypothetical protein